jgi:hypothetical protein
MAAERLEGKRARIEFHEEQRGQFRNVYLDAVDEAEPTTASEEDTDVDEVAWKAAVDAAPSGSSAGAVSAGIDSRAGLRGYQRSDREAD